ncbi:hypothetical protein HQ571_02915 [Candidatus Kuenenbacteria bacterium]|nr:hypothetical protein [Candidatus Kuenenbacteria bacterium]
MNPVISILLIIAFYYFASLSSRLLGESQADPASIVLKQKAHSALTVAIIILLILVWQVIVIVTS